MNEFKNFNHDEIQFSIIYFIFSSIKEETRFNFFISYKKNPLQFNLLFFLFNLKKMEDFKK